MKTEVKPNFRIVRLAPGDVRCKSDHLSNLRGLILANHDMYPAIERWYKDKVLVGIRQEERVAFVGYLDEQAVVSAVVKKGAEAKFCHLRISEEFQNTHLGEVFFSLMSLEVRGVARSVHFTLPESLWHQKGSFFHSFGFSQVQSSDRQYRLIDQELHSATPFSVVWRSAVQKMPKLVHAHSIGGYSPDNHLLLSVHPRYAEDILSKRKTVELRRRFSTKWLGCRINLYATAPVMSLVGEARIAGVVVDMPETIWQRFHSQIGCTRAEFDRYAKGAEEVYAIQLDEIRPYKNRIPLVQACQMLGENLVPPQSYVTLEKNKSWAKAVSLAAYLHACFKSTIHLAMDISQISPRPMRKAKSNAFPPSLTQTELNWVT